MNSYLHIIYLICVIISISVLIGCEEQSLTQDLDGKIDTENKIEYKGFNIEEISEILYLMDNDFRSDTENFVFILNELPEDILVFGNAKSAISSMKVNSFIEDSKSWTIENCKFPLGTVKIGDSYISLPIEGMPILNIAFTSKTEYFQFLISLPTDPGKEILNQWWIIPKTYVIRDDKTYYCWDITPHWQQPKIACD